MSVFDAWASAASTATQAAAVRNETRKKTGLLAGQATGALQDARTAWGGRRASGRLPGSVRRTSCRQGLSPPALRPPPSQPRAPSLHPFPPIASAEERRAVPAGGLDLSSRAGQIGRRAGLRTSVSARSAMAVRRILPARSAGAVRPCPLPASPRPAPPSRWRGHCRPVPAGTMSAFEAWAKVTSPTVAQAATTKTEVWKKAGLATV